MMSNVLLCIHLLHDGRALPVCETAWEVLGTQINKASTETGEPLLSTQCDGAGV